MNDQKKKFAFRINELLNLSYDERLSWIETHIPDFDEHCYGEGYLGAFYPSETDISDFLNDPEDYGVSGLIASQNSEISDVRLSEINAGAELTETEKENLIAAIAEADVDGWITHNAFEITLLDGSIYAYFNGYSLGPGGFDFKFFSFFKTYEELLRHITSLPMSYVE